MFIYFFAEKCFIVETISFYQGKGNCAELHVKFQIHNEEQRHICDVCMKSFARADKLKDHMIRHLQIKRYACRLCPKAYNEKRDLTKHLEKIHSGHTNLDTRQELIIGNS